MENIPNSPQVSQESCPLHAFPLAIETGEACLAVWLAILLTESALIELSQTKSTAEVLGMELSSHCSHTSTCDWLITSGTQ